MSLHDAAVLSGQISPIFSDGPDLALRKWCIEKAETLNPKDAGDLIKKAAGIYNWITKGATNE